MGKFGKNNKRTGPNKCTGEKIMHIKNKKYQYLKSFFGKGHLFLNFLPLFKGLESAWTRFTSLMFGG